MTEKDPQGHPVVPAGRRHPSHLKRILASGGYLKDRVYVNIPKTLPDLKAAITAAIRVIPQEQCGRVIENFVRSDTSLAAAPGCSFGAHFMSSRETWSF